MAEPRKRVDITSADSKQLGFEYQYLYFIVRLLQLHPNEEVGYEALDDVHVVSYNNQKTYFVQLKHTVEVAANGEQANLTKLSDDLWKTLSNWSKLITDTTEGRKEKVAQRDFINNSNFVFVVNRIIEENEIVTHIQQLKESTITGNQFISFLKELQNKTKDTAIKGYICNVIKLGIQVLVLFMKNITFVNTPNSLFDTIREGIRNKMIADEYIDEVLGSLYLQLKEDFFDKVQRGRHQIITHTEWTRKYQSVFNVYRATLLPIRIYHPLLPKHLEQQYFVKELVEIGAIDWENDGLAEIAELTEHYLRVKLQLDDWYNEGRITYTVLQEFHKDAALNWKRIHQYCHRTTKNNPSKDIENALMCFDNVMKEKLTLLSAELGMSMSNGEFIKLANEEKIGWKYSWKEGYRINGD
jgi:hypothetical protein